MSLRVNEAPGVYRFAGFLYTSRQICIAAMGFAVLELPEFRFSVNFVAPNVVCWRFYPGLPRVLANADTGISYLVCLMVV